MPCPYGAQRPYPICYRATTGRSRRCRRRRHKQRPYPICAWTAWAAIRAAASMLSLSVFRIRW